jgi:hypothetical protein
MSDTNALRLRIADELDRQAADIIGSPSLSVGYAINREINSAIQHYESTRFRWNEVRETALFTTVAGARTYSLPADFIRMDTLKLSYSGSYIHQFKRAWDEVESRDRNVAGSQGLPSEYTIYGNVVRFGPVVPNGAYTAVGSYIRRFRPTSLTGSYCAIITMGGGSLTATSSASHVNRLDGWTTDGEELIRARAKAAFQMNYARDQNALIELKMLAASGAPYLSLPEKLAYSTLSGETAALITTGRVTPWYI